MAATYSHIHQWTLSRSARTTRGFFLLPAGTECWLQLDVGFAKFMLFDDENCAVTLAEVPLAAVLAPELGILHRDEAIRNERMRLKASPARMIGWEEYEDCAPPRLPGS